MVPAAGLLQAATRLRVLLLLGVVLSPATLSASEGPGVQDERVAAREQQADGQEEQAGAREQQAAGHDEQASAQQQHGDAHEKHAGAGKVVARVMLGVPMAIFDGGTTTVADVLVLAPQGGAGVFFTEKLEALVVFVTAFQVAEDGPPPRSRFTSWNIQPAVRWVFSKPWWIFSAPLSLKGGPVFWPRYGGTNRFGFGLQATEMMGWMLTDRLMVMLAPQVVLRLAPSVELTLSMQLGSMYSF